MDSGGPRFGGHGDRDAQAQLALTPQEIWQACQAGDYPECVHYADLLAGGRGVTQSNDEAVRILGGTCDKGYAPACTQLGIWNESGVQMNPNRERANSYYRRGCEMGSSEGCARLGIAYEQGTGVIQNSGNAVSYYRQACGLGRQSSCVKLGTLYENGQGVSQDRGRAAALYLQACQELDANGCRAAREHVRERAGSGPRSRSGGGTLSPGLRDRERPCLPSATAGGSQHVRNPLRQASGSPWPRNAAPPSLKSDPTSGPRFWKVARVPAVV